MKFQKGEGREPKGDSWGRRGPPTPEPPLRGNESTSGQPHLWTGLSTVLGGPRDRSPGLARAHEEDSGAAVVPRLGPWWSRVSGVGDQPQAQCVFAIMQGPAPGHLSPASQEAACPPVQGLFLFPFPKFRVEFLASTFGLW